MTEDLKGAAGRAQAAATRPLRIASAPKMVAAPPRPKTEAVALLSQVVARLHAADAPVVQFIQVSPDTKPGHVARDFAEAALARFGQTLLASLQDTADSRDEAQEILANVAARRRSRRPVQIDPEIVPDSALQGLYHVRVGTGLQELGQAWHAPPALWLGEARLSFRLLVIDCGPLERNPVAVELASRCHGSILTVAAGLTRLAEIRAAAQQVQLAGGTLLGSVLYDAARHWQPFSRARKRSPSGPLRRAG